MIDVARGVWLSSLLLCLALTLLWQTFELGPTARFVPQFVIGPTVALLLFQLCLDLSPKVRAAIREFTRFQTARTDQLRRRTQSVEDRSQPGSLGVDLGWFVLAPALICILGFTLSAPIYTLLFLRLRAREPLRRCFLTALIVGAAVLGFFHFIPNVPSGGSQLLEWPAASHIIRLP